MKSKKVKLLTGLGITFVVLGLLAIGTYAKFSPQALSEGEEIVFEEEKKALLTISTDKVEIMAAGSEAWVPATNGQQVVAGTKVRTNENGLAEITYPTGTLSSIDTNTEITLAEFSPTPQKVKVNITAGRVWSSIIKLLGGESYETQSTDMVATVRGTSYMHAVLPNKKAEIVTTEHNVAVTCGTTNIEVAENKMIEGDCQKEKPKVVPTSNAIKNDSWVKGRLSAEPKRREVVEEKKREREEKKQEKERENRKVESFVTSLLKRNGVEDNDKKRKEEVEKNLNDKEKSNDKSKLNKNSQDNTNINGLNNKIESVTTQSEDQKISNQQTDISNNTNKLDLLPQTQPRNGESFNPMPEKTNLDNKVLPPPPPSKLPPK